MLKFSVPLLHVSLISVAERFYCDGLGFRRTFATRIDDSKDDPCYMGVVRDGVTLHISSFPGDGVAGNVVNFFVDDLDALHRELIARNVAIDLAPTDQTWGNREMYVRDPDKNCIRFIVGRP